MLSTNKKLTYMLEIKMITFDQISAYKNPLIMEILEKGASVKRDSF